MPLPKPARQPLFRKGDKIAMIATLFVLLVTIAGSAAIAGSLAPTDLQQRGFNPQPEPPPALSGHVAPGSTRAFNPQPEPPAQSKTVRR